MKSAAAVALATLFVATAFGQTSFPDPANLRDERVRPRTGRELPVDQGAMGLQQVLRKLNTRASLMLIVAHPDDEDGGMLTFYSRGMGARVADLSLTRGEGGQNAMTGDFEDALGLIRTQELLSADRYFGADQIFGTEVDFGFSKTKEEAFTKWTHERVLYDAVRAVRLYRPLVIAAVFVGGVTDGHGQHQVSGEIAQEVFKAAADPKVFPELTREGILPWAPLKVYARVPTFAITEKGLFDYATNQYAEPHFTNYVTGETTAKPPMPDVVIHEGDTDPLLSAAAANPADLPRAESDPGSKLSYVQFARIGLGLQRTQIGPGVRTAAPGAYDVSYHRYGSRLAQQPGQEKSFFDGIDTSVEAIATLCPAPPPVLRDGVQQLSREIAAITKGFHPQNPEASAAPLVAAQHDLGALLYSLEQMTFAGKTDVLHELRVKQVELNDAIVLALDLQLTATPKIASAEMMQGSTAQVELSLTSRSGEPIGVYSAVLRGSRVDGPEKLLAVEKEPVLTAEKPFAITLPTNADLTSVPTRPYFRRDSIEQPVYQLTDRSLRNAPATPAPLVAAVTLRYHETEVQVSRVVSVDRQAVQIVPSASVSLSSHAQVLPPYEKTLAVAVNVYPPHTRVELTLPPSWKEPSETDPTGAAPGTKLFQLEPPSTEGKPFTLQATAALPDGKQAREGYRSVGYGTLQRTLFFTPASSKIVPVDLRLPEHRRIGYLPGTGDAVADNLRSIGLPLTLLSVADLTPQRLASFDSVVLGVRTYNAHPDLHGAATQALFDFARAGGNVIVQYQSGEFTGADAPYPLSLGNAEKVVDEGAPVRLLLPTKVGAGGADGSLQFRALNSPNRIGPSDFEGWVEERGHGFLQSWDPRYDALTETHDPGQAPQRGGLITTSLGQGHWTYCAFALYRQLPEAVPGAFRLFTDLLGLADAK